MDSVVIAALVGAIATLLSIWLKFYLEQKKENKETSQSIPPSQSSKNKEVSLQEVEAKIISRGVIGVLIGGSLGAIIGGVTGYSLYSSSLGISLGSAVGSIVLGIFGMICLILWKIYPSASLGIGIGSTVGAIWGANIYVKSLGFIFFVNWSHLFTGALKKSLTSACVGAIAGMVLGIFLRGVIQKIYSTQPFS